MSEVTVGVHTLRSYIPLIAVPAFLLLSQVAFGIRLLVKGPYEPPTEKARAYQASLLSRFSTHWWWWLFEPLARALVSRRVSPNVLTWLQLPVAAAAAALFALGHFGAAGWIVCFGGSLDMLDGMVAKATGRVTRAGGFLDSTLDRYVDFLILAGFIAYYRDTLWWLVPAAALMGTMAVPYIRAKGEALGVAPPEGGMQRPERVFFLGCPPALSPLFAVALEPGASHPAYHVALVGIGLTAVFSNLTAARRFRYVLSRLRAADAGAPPAEPSSGVP